MKSVKIMKIIRIMGIMKIMKIMMEHEMKIIIWQRILIRKWRKGSHVLLSAVSGTEVVTT